MEATDRLVSARQQRQIADPVTTQPAPAPSTAMTNAGPTAQAGVTEQTLETFPDTPWTWPVGGPRPSRREATRTDPTRTDPSVRAKPKPAVFLREAIQRRSLVLADMTSAALALVVGVTLAGDDQLTPLSLVALPLVVLASKMIGLYDREELVLRKSTLEDAPKLFQLATFYALVLWLLENTLVVGTLGHRQILGLWAVFFFSSLVARTSARALCQTFGSTERCLVMGNPAFAERLRGKLDSGGVNAAVVGSVGLEEREGQIPWSALSLHRVIREHNAHRIVIAPRHADSREVLDLVRTLSSLGVRVSVFPRMIEVVGSSVEFDDVHGLPVLGIRRFGVSRSSCLLKRVFDLLGAGVGLLLFSPLLALIAVAIKVDSPGPVLFRQRRVGRDGEGFEILKFRTMVDGADSRKAELLDRNEAQGFFKIENDPRITPVGRLLRRASLDELPQLWNVMRGQMSLVGPRPLVGEEDERVQGWDRSRLHLTPGMTGPWQILGSSRVPLHEMVKIDYLYTANWSLWADVKLILRTVPYMARRNGQ
jgi:exopolysaccharide biosynthesis polyprenyl glycosylphosphotransferase